MPGPFPGMDPFLESPKYFPSLQFRMIMHMAGDLQRRLSRPYFADLGLCEWQADHPNRVRPDINVTARGDASHHGASKNSSSEPQGAGVHRFVEIRKILGDEERLVATIELLTPAIKTIGSEEREFYFKIQHRLKRSGPTHLVEIDLLRAGAHARLIPLDVLQPRVGSFDYHVSVSSCLTPNELAVYPFQLPDRLPKISIPLLPGDGSVALNLQAVLDDVYDAGPYRRRVQYSLDALDPPIPESQIEWVKQLLADRDSELRNGDD